MACYHNIVKIMHTIKSMILNLGYTNSDMINYYFHFSILFKYAVKGATILENPFTTFDIS